MTGPLPVGYEERRVCDLWRRGTGWEFSQILPYVPENLKLQLTAVVLDEVIGAKDRLSWAENADGNFTVKSGYVILTRDSLPKQSMERFF